MNTKDFMVEFADMNFASAWDPISPGLFLRSAELVLDKSIFSMEHLYLRNVVKK